jgi:hypothetical protein
LARAAVYPNNGQSLAELAELAPEVGEAVVVVVANVAGAR